MTSTFILGNIAVLFLLIGVVFMALKQSQLVNSTRSIACMLAAIGVLILAHLGK